MDRLKSDRGTKGNGIDAFRVKAMDFKHLTVDNFQLDIDEVNGEHKLIRSMPQELSECLR